MHEYELIFKEFLQRKGLKLTEPRQLILNAAFELHTHFDAEQLYARIRNISNEVSLATVYRSIPLLLEAGLIQNSGRNSLRETYEHILGHPQHLHWICDRCRTVYETDIADLLPSLEQLANNLKFCLREPRISLHGICWKCQSTENENQ